MAVLVRRWLLLPMLLSSMATCCTSDSGTPSDIAVRALQCFSRQNIYRRCQESYQLTAQGVINVPQQAVDAYCDGPCLGETRLVLDCVDNILSNFLFDNGAMTRNVRNTILAACGNTGRRGDFDVFDQMNGEFDEGFKLAVPLLITSVMAIVVSNLILCII